MPKLSIVIPIKDEEENLPKLYDHLVTQLSEIKVWEAILVDDGSQDRSWSIIKSLVRQDSRIQAIQLRRNFGQAAAMQSGIDFADGDYIATMDGDLQNDAADLPLMMQKIEEGYDVVLGLRANRNDSLMIRKIPSKIANWVIRKVINIPFRDFGCTIRVMRKEIAKNLKLYGEMHRFIPVLAQQQGARMTQIPVRHHPRQLGKTKYGLGRTRRVILDLITVKFLSAYLTRPMHFLGGAGLIVISLGILSLLATLSMKIFQSVDMTGNPLLLLSVLLSLIGVQLVSVGLLGEVMIRTYFESQNKAPYQIRELAQSREAVEIPDESRKVA